MDTKESCNFFGAQKFIFEMVTIRAKFIAHDLSDGLEQLVWNQSKLLYGRMRN
jgi:hypothetical protein